MLRAQQAGEQNELLDSIPIVVAGEDRGQAKDGKPRDRCCVSSSRPLKTCWRPGTSTVVDLGPCPSVIRTRRICVRSSVAVR